MRHAPPPRNSRTSLLIIMLGRAPESPPPGSIPLSTVGLCILDYAGIVLLSETHWAKANGVRSYELSVRCLFFTLLYSIEEYVDHDVHCFYLLSYVMCQQLSLNYGGPKIQYFVSAPISLLSASILFSRHPSHPVLTALCGSSYMLLWVAMSRCYDSGGTLILMTINWGWQEKNFGGAEPRNWGCREKRLYFGAPVRCVYGPYYAYMTLLIKNCIYTHDQITATQ